MNQSSICNESNTDCSEVEHVAGRLLDRIRSELIDLDDSFNLDSDLFHAGMDSMTIMQILLIIEEEFNAKLPDYSIKSETFVTARRIAKAVIAQRIEL